MKHLNYPLQSRNASATVIVLCIVVLLTFLIVAFLTQSLIERQVSFSNAARERTDLLAHSVTNTITAELLDEMRYGNIPTAIVNGTNSPSGPLLSNARRLTNSYPSKAATVVPSLMLGTNSGTGSAMNLVKMSVQGRVSYSGTLNFPDGPADSTKVAAYGGATTIPSRNGRMMTTARWNRMGLLTGTTGFIPPDWIRITKNGPEKLGTGRIALADAANPSKTTCVIGRYAYTMANLGGLLDINMIGNGFSVADPKNTSRIRLHQADFTAIRSGTDTAMNEAAIRERLIKWRWSNDASDASPTGWLFSGSNSFLTSGTGHNSIFSRDDLLAFQKKNPDILTFSDLAYLTVGSYEKNQPAFDIERNDDPDPGDSTAPGVHSLPFNQSIARTVYTTGPKVGMRVLGRRFNLNKIDLLKNGSVDDIKKYFGLTASTAANATTNDWTYTGTASSNGSPIRALSEIAKDNNNPEPNFFEILRAVINENTLGIEQDGAGWVSVSGQRIIPDYQIFQIGANIIDQWDSDDDPTSISDSSTPPVQVWGLENLPYIDHVFAWSSPSTMQNGRYPDPAVANSRINMWLVPKLWNPNRNAKESTITHFRVTGAFGSQPCFNLTNVGAYTVGPARTTPPPPAGSDPVALDLIGSLKNYYSVVDLAKTSITFDSDVAANNYNVAGPGGSSTKFSEPAIPRVGTLAVEVGSTVIRGAGTDANAVADSGQLTGAGTTNYLGLLGGSITIDIPANNIGTFAINTNNSGHPYSLQLQYSKNGSDWRPYQEFGAFVDGGGNGFTDKKRGAFNATCTMNGLFASDPRCQRATRANVNNAKVNASNPVNNANTMFPYLWYDGTLMPDTTSMDSYNPMNFTHITNKLQNTISADNPAPGPLPGLLIALPTDAQQKALHPGGPASFWLMSVASAWNTADSIYVENNPTLYTTTFALLDRDFRLRFADSASLPAVNNYNFSTAISATNLGPFVMKTPLVTSGSSVPFRPVILNRPFRNVGELGYVLRDQPWKTLNFSAVPWLGAATALSNGTHFIPGKSGDSGLLEAFTLVDPPEQAGKVDLNTRNTRVLQAVLQGSECLIATGSSNAYQYSAADAALMAQNMVASTALKPVFNLANLATYITGGTATNAKDAYNNAKWIFPVISTSGLSKEQLEAPLRSLSALGTTRTWNLGVDLVVQTGKYPPGVRVDDGNGNGGDFVVESQQRYFLNLILDRFNGEIISVQVEPVYE